MHIFDDWNSDYIVPSTCQMYGKLMHDNKDTKKFIYSMQQQVHAKNLCEKPEDVEKLIFKQ